MVFDTHKDRGILFKIAFFVFGLIPLFSGKGEVYVTIFFCLLVVIDFLFFSDLKKDKPQKRIFLINSLLFIVLLISFHDEINLAIFKELEQMVSLLVFPIIIYLVKIQDKIAVKVLFELWKKVFFISLVLFSLISFYIISQYSNPRYPNFDSNFFQNAILDTPYLSKHPGYISLYINISILIGINWLVDKVKGRFVIVICLLILLILLLMLSVKIALISILASSLSFLYLSFSKKKFFIGFSCLLFFFLSFNIFVPKKYNRFSKLFEKNIFEENTKYNSILIHKLTIICSAKIFKENWITGVGIENSKKMVNNCVRSKFSHNPEKIYNSHNQYLAFGLHSGVFGFLVLIFVLSLAFYKSYKSDNLMFAVMTLYCIVFFTENILDRQTGVILFSFLLNIIPAKSESKLKCHKIENQK